MLPAPVGKKGQRPTYPYMLLIVDSRTAIVLGSEVLVVESTWEDMWGSIPMAVADQLAKYGVPREIKVCSSPLCQVLEALAEEVGFKLTRSDALPSLDPAKAMMLQRFF